MALEPGGYADKIGNRYEGRWVVRQLLRLLAEDLQSVQCEPVGDEERGVDLWVERSDVGDNRVDSGKSLDVDRMKDGTLRSFVDGEHRAILGSFNDDFTPFELRVDVIDIDESSGDPKPPLLGRFVWTIRPSDIGQEIRPAGSTVEYYGDDNVMLAVRVNWLETD